jgi:isocitrate/isopropylmalate dehydrogenase
MRLWGFLIDPLALLRWLPIFLIMVISGVMASVSEGADWVAVREDESGTYMGDRESLAKSSGPVKEARELSVMKNHPEISRSLEVAEYDCSAAKRRTIQKLTYLKTGGVSLIPTVNAPWIPVKQDQTAQIFFKFACKK